MSFLSGDAEATQDRGARGEITWLERFYDLVFVAALIQAGHSLAENLTLGGAGRDALVLALLWRLWSGTAVRFARCSADSVGRRFIVFAKIFATASLAAIAGHGFERATAAFLRDRPRVPRAPLPRNGATRRDVRPRAIMPSGS